MQVVDFDLKTIFYADSFDSDSGIIPIKMMMSVFYNAACKVRLPKQYMLFITNTATS